MTTAAGVDTAQDAEEHQLSQRLFGKWSHDTANVMDEEGDEDLEHVEDTQLFTLDTAAPAQARSAQPAIKSFVWVDEDDERISVPLVGRDARAPDGSARGTKRLRKLRAGPDERVVSGAEYQTRLRKQFERLHPRPAWAMVGRQDRTQDTGAWNAPLLRDLLSSSTGLVGTHSSRAHVHSSRLEVERLRDANEALGRSVEPAAIEHVQFHPSPRTHVLLTASRDRRTRLFQVNGKDNPLLETLHVPDMPIKTALFNPAGTSVVIAGPRPYLYAYDIRTGKTTRSSPWRGAGKIVSSAAATEADAGAERDLSFICFAPGSASKLVAIGGRRGQVHLLDWGAGATGQTGGQRIGELRMNAPLAGMAWDPNAEERLLTLSSEGRVHIWDIRSRACPVTAYDPSLFGAKGLEISPSAAVGTHWAIGSASGVVNVYGGDTEKGTGSAALDTLAATPATASVTEDVQLSAARSLGNLTTAVTSMCYSHDAQLLAIASRNKKDALRMRAHLWGTSRH
ncbi:hypothetical protein MVES_002900 [Malassezia vespertilionis]|uniref:Utp18p n=1 Tax=Malassezia vespertilionis TaxID=2020962 RepID=A0A2N1J9I4_9BASI|nr:hypothetical protein MVES_002900 [Malassezia vespertilionis]